MPATEDQEPASSGNTQNEREVGKVPTARQARRGPAPQACTECRRLKLRCNRQSPCATCLKRGVLDRCTGATSPEVATDPASLLLAAAASTVRELQDRNKALEKHITELQQAVLDVLHGDTSVMKPEHILHAELIELKHKNKVAACIDKSEMQTQLVESFGTLTVSSDKEHTSWLGSTASSEFFIERNEGLRDFKTSRWNFDQRGFPAEVMFLGRVFAFSPTQEEKSQNARAALRSVAPSKDIAYRLCDNFFVYGSWLSQPVCRTEFFEETFEPLLNAPDWNSFTYDRISLLFSVLSVGVLLDVGTEARHSHSYRLHKIGCGALGLSEYLESPSITSCQTLVTICLFHLFSDDPDGPSRCWGITGLVLRLAQSVGLHRKNTVFEQNPKEYTRRSRLWWEISFLDRIQSLFYGRPSGIITNQCDMPLPKEEPGQSSYEVAKYRFVDECLVPVLNQALAVLPPSYATILKLDKKIRDFKNDENAPPQDSPESLSLNNTLQNYALNGYKEMTLLYLHRSAFIAALREHPQDPLKHKFAPSVLAVHKAACVVIWNTHLLLQQYSFLVPRLYIWCLHAFSASVLLAALITRSPGSNLTPSALKKLDYALSCFEQCKENVRMSTALPIVLKFRNMARKAFASFQAGQDPRPSEADQEQLSILSGTTQVVFSGAAAQEDSPNSSSDSGSVITPSSDLHSTLQQHFRAVEWEQQQYDPLNTVFESTQNMSPPPPVLPPPTFGYGASNATSADPLGLSAFSSLAAGQLPMPLDGVNFNFNVVQEQNSEDPLDFLLSTQIANETASQSWDYVAGQE